MEPLEKITELEFADKISNEKRREVDQQLVGLENVGIVEFTPVKLKIKFFPHQYSESYFKEELTRIGIKFSKRKRKGLFKRMLETLAKGNRETFGEGEMECCKLNKM